MVNLMIQEVVDGNEKSATYARKTHLSAFEAAHNAVLKFWLAHSKSDFPSDVMNGCVWHIQPTSDVAMVIKIESEELAKHQLYLLCAIDDITARFARFKGIRPQSKPLLELVTDDSSKCVCVMQFASETGLDHHVLRCNPKMGCDDYRIYKTIRMVEHCVDREWARVACVDLADEWLENFQDDFHDDKMGAAIVDGNEKLKDQLKLRLLLMANRIFNQALSLLVFDECRPQTTPGMEESLAKEVDDVFMLETQPYFLPGALQAGLSAMNLAMAMRVEDICGGSFVERFKPTEFGIKHARAVCDICSKTSVNGAFPPGYEVARRTLGYLGLDRYVELSFKHIWGSEEVSC